MPRLTLLLLLGSLLLLCQACGEEEYGFSKNPLNLMINTGKYLSGKGNTDITPYFAKGALCIWFPTENLALLKKNLPYKSNDLAVETKPLEKLRYDDPRFVGFWSYYTDTYIHTVLEKKTKIVVMEIKTECDFGAPGVKVEKDRLNKKLGLPRKECKIVEIVPRSFQAPPPPADCSLFS